MLRIKDGTSRRAVLLKQFLNAIDSDNWLPLQDLVNDLYNERGLWWLQDDYEITDSDLEILGDLTSSLKRFLGRVESDHRTRFTAVEYRGKLQALVEKHCSKLSSEGDRLVSGLGFKKWIDLAKTECIDARYAGEVLQKLSKIVARATRLERLPRLLLPNLDVQRAFEEAHRCYLYGFGLGSTILCRSTIECALQDHLSKQRKSLPTRPEELTLNDLLQVPASRTLLGDYYHFADKVRQAGNKAVHRPADFDVSYSFDEIEALLINTRQVIEHLYHVV